MHQVIYQDVVGEPERPVGAVISSLPLPDSLKEGLISFFGGDIHLSPPQAWAYEQGILDADSHFLVCAPTNSGKTLIALLRIFGQAIISGSRSVYVVPLKALAEEKADELGVLAKYVEQSGGPRIKIRVSTGDYQLSNDFLGSPPPATGEVLICTPERLEVILRNPDNSDWAQEVKTYVLDEFHLLGERGRGANMESLITRLMVDVPESTLIGLSATIGNPDNVAGWLGHTGRSVHVLSSAYRFPTLERTVIETEGKNSFIIDKAKAVVGQKQGSLLVFVYRKSDAEKLNKLISSDFEKTGAIAYFHAGLSLADRRRVAENFRTGKIRVLISTTSLKMGINTPTSQVIVRDTVFHGAGRLAMTDVLQMLGRAGRGDNGGEGFILCDPNEDASSYVDGLKCSIIEPLGPQLFEAKTKAWMRKQSETEDKPVPMRAALLGEIARHKQVPYQFLEDFLQHSFSAWCCDMQYTPDIQSDLSFLERGKLIYRVENSESTYSATKLGRTVVFSGLSPESGSTLASFIRALINLGDKTPEDQPKKNYLRRLTNLDLLFLSLASFEARTQLLRSSSSKARSLIDEYIEALPVEEKPLLYLWRSATSPSYPTRRLISSLGFVVDGTDKQNEAIFYKLMATAVLLNRHAKGEELGTLSKEFGIHEGAIENGLKYTVTWVLSCLAQICSSDKCYKLDFISMRAYELLEDLSLGAPLGKLMSIKGVGRRSVMKLANNGYLNLSDISQLSEHKMQGLGLKTKQAKRIEKYLKRLRR